MIINKITAGFVIQQWDTEKKAWVGQEFVCDADGEFEYDVSQNDIDDAQDPADAANESNGGEEPYLNFDMVQP